MIVEIYFVDFFERQTYGTITGNVMDVLKQLSEFIKDQVQSFDRCEVSIHPYTFEPILTFYFNNAHDATFFKLMYG